MIKVPEAVMGTVVSLSIDAPDADSEKIWLAVAEARAVLHQADAVFSTWKPLSPLSRLRRGEIGLEECPGEVAEVLRLAAAARDLSGGWFDPWALPGGVDPTGLVKGWAAARALERIAAAGARSAMVSAGGDVGTFGDPGHPWRIGITGPWDRRGLAGVVEVEGAGAVCTSGSYERGAHLIDPATGQPADRTVSATVVGPDLALADALATALAVGGDEALRAIDAAAGYEGWVIRPDGSTGATAGWRLASGHAAA
ncbi:MAG TPA: FAD:protein FMN transferase [Acidimicrobiales bacterium]